MAMSGTRSRTETEEFTKANDLLDEGFDAREDPVDRDFARQRQPSEEPQARVAWLGGEPR